MSYAALRALPYDKSESKSALLPGRLVRPSEGTQVFEGVELKLILNEKAEHVVSSLSRVVENEGVPPTFPEPDVLEADYRDWCVNAFGAGVIIVAIGLILLVVLSFTRTTAIGIASASCLVIGTSAVALSLLRGEDIEGVAS